MSEFDKRKGRASAHDPHPAKDALTPEFRRLGGLVSGLEAKLGLRHDDPEVWLNIIMRGHPTFMRLERLGDAALALAFRERVLSAKVNGVKDFEKRDLALSNQYLADCCKYKRYEDDHSIAEFLDIPETSYVNPVRGKGLHSDCLEAIFGATLLHFGYAEFSRLVDNILFLPHAGDLADDAQAMLYPIIAAELLEHPLRLAPNELKEKLEQAQSYFGSGRIEEEFNRDIIELGRKAIQVYIIEQRMRLSENEQLALDPAPGIKSVSWLMTKGRFFGSGLRELLPRSDERMSEITTTFSRIVGLSFLANGHAKTANLIAPFVRIAEDRA